ncbi:MAG: hypothetical protein Q9160_001550 [Pyrenula sp. 1 TL-2023]
MNLPVNLLSSFLDSLKLMKLLDASFEVLGAPYSLLSISLSPSQELYTRRGTLVGLHGDADGVRFLAASGTEHDAYDKQTISTLRILEPFRRTLQGIPFLYQKVGEALHSSPTPLNLPDSLNLTHKCPCLDEVLLDILRRFTPKRNYRLEDRAEKRPCRVDRPNAVSKANNQLRFGRSLQAWISHEHVLIRAKTWSQWGQSQAIGRGLLALSGKGQIFSVELRPGERYIAHPSNVVAYSLSRTLPRPYRFKSSTLRFEIPKLDLNRLFPDSKFFRTMQETATWKFLTSSLFHLRTWARRTIWGDRLFLQFEGPTTILLQSRGARLTDALSTRDVNEIADTQAGVTQKAIEQAQIPQSQRQEDTDSDSDSDPSLQSKRTSTPPRPVKPPKLNVATIRRDGKVEIEPGKDARAFST